MSKSARALTCSHADIKIGRDGIRISVAEKDRMAPDTVIVLETAG